MRDTTGGNVLGLGDWLFGIFEPYGTVALLLFIMLIFFIDAILFPTLPELFFVIVIVSGGGGLLFGFEVLIIVAIAEILGVTLLYLIVEKIRVPKKLKNVVDKYIKFLVVSDERILLVNRVAPVIPFTGAFISLVESWKYTKCMLYILIGCLVKYGVIMAIVVFLNERYANEVTQYTLVFIIIVIAISIVASFLKKKKLEKEGLIENS